MALHPEHLEDLKKSGLMDTSIEAARIYSVPPRDIPKKLGFDSPRIQSLLAFPYDGDFERFKVFPPLENKDGHTQKYFQRKGTPCKLYIPPQRNDVLGDPQTPLAIVEGEKKTLRLVQEGIPAVGIGGIWSWTQNGCAVSDFEKIAWKGRTVNLFPDSDVWQREDLRKAVYTLAKELEKRGANVIICKLPMQGEIKTGVDDFLLQGHSLKELMALPKTTTSGPEFEGLESWHIDREVRKVTEQVQLNSLFSLNSHPWPVLKPEALYGLAGDVVRAIEPHSEADPVALLLNILASFGNVIGSGPHFVAEADRHALKISDIKVGETSKGRKGSAWGHIRQLFQLVDSEWVKERVQSGLASGEGLIWAVRDPIERQEPIKVKGKVTGYQTVIVDEGIDDKRLLALESEFASVLKVCSREGNTLSAVIRQAWDGHNLRTLTKNSPAKATGAHISILGHITKEELLRYLDTTEMANGFGNRFLWICVKRSKTLPEGGGHINLDPLTKRLHEAVEFARTVEEIKRDEEARKIWHEVYGPLSEGKPGLLGALISRAEAQVMRLACIYALMDESILIRKEHLLAALSLWDYCEASVRYIFGSATGDYVADRILVALEQAPEGLSLSKIHDLFGRHQKAGRIDKALTALLSRGIIRRDERQTGGRPAEVFLLNNGSAK